MTDQNLQRQSMTDSRMTTSEDAAYNAAATYRQSLAWITAKAVDHLQHCNVEWKHAKIYAVELDNVPVPDVPGPKYGEILEEAKKVLRALVNAR